MTLWMWPLLGHKQDENGNAPQGMSAGTWLYLYRYSKLGAHHFWKGKADNAIEEQGRSLSERTIRYRMERMRIDHTPIKTPSFKFHASANVLDKMIDMVDLFVAAYPDVFMHASAKLRIEIKDERVLCKAFSAFAEELFSNGINWGLIVAFFAFSASLAVECVHFGRSILVRGICDWTSLFIAIRLKDWIIENGGWEGIVVHFNNLTCSEKRTVKHIPTTFRDYLHSPINIKYNKITWLNLLLICVLVLSLLYIYHLQSYDYVNTTIVGDRDTRTVVGKVIQSEEL